MTYTTVIFTVFYFGVCVIEEYNNYSKTIKGIFFFKFPFISEVDEVLLPTTSVTLRFSQWWPNADSSKWSFWRMKQTYTVVIKDEILGKGFLYLKLMMQFEDH